MNDCKNVLLLIAFHLEDEHDFISCFLEDIFYCDLLGTFSFTFIIANAEFLHFLRRLFGLLLLIVLLGGLLRRSLLGDLILLVDLLNKFGLLRLLLLGVERPDRHIRLSEIQYLILPDLALNNFSCVLVALLSNEGRSRLLGVIVN